MAENDEDVTERNDGELSRRSALKKGGVVAGGLAVGGAASSGTASGSDAGDATATQRRGAVTETFEFQLETVNTCLDPEEFVTGQLTIRTTVMVSDLRPGGYTVSIVDHAHGTASGDQGNEYVFNDQMHFHTVTAGAETLTERFRGRLISKGPAPDEVIEGSHHVTINANGEVTSVKTELSEIYCVG